MLDGRSVGFVSVTGRCDSDTLTSPRRDGEAITAATIFASTPRPGIGRQLALRLSEADPGFGRAITLARLSR